MPSASKAPGLISPDLVARFRADAGALLPARACSGRGNAAEGGGGGAVVSHSPSPDTSGEEIYALAISGGPDSMAMLLLAAAAFPDRIVAATVDHGLRAEARTEAQLAADACENLGIPHATLTVIVAPGASVQAQARAARYAALTEWAKGQGAVALLTAHHADDQAETILMRLSRGSGLAGLSGIRDRRDLGDGLALIRPLLRWRRAELAAIAAGVATVDDPSNRDPRHDRTRARALLAETDWIDPARLAATAHHLAESEAAIGWLTAEVIRSRCAVSDGEIAADLAGLPREIVRRVLAELIVRAESRPDGPALDRLLDRLEKGQPASIGGSIVTPGARWIIQKAPERH